MTNKYQEAFDTIQELITKLSVVIDKASDELANNEYSSKHIETLRWTDKEWKAWLFNEEK